MTGRGRRVPLASVLREFGISDATVEREIVSLFGRPKTVVRWRNRLLFVGSVRILWLQRSYRERLLGRVEAMRARLAAQCDDVRIPAYNQTAGGRYFVKDGPYYRFVRDYAEGREATPADGLLMARCLGVLHRASLSRALPGERSHRDHRWTIGRHMLPALKAAPGRGLPSPLLGEHIERLRVVLRHRAAAINALPAIVNHNDLQPKNLIVQHVDGRPVAIPVDLEECQLQPRITDLYFLLTGDDSAALLGDEAGFTERLREYVHCSWPFCPAEIDLLPDVLFSRAAQIATYVSRGYRSSPEPERTALRRYFHAALRSMEYVHRNKDRIREIAARS